LIILIVGSAKELVFTVIKRPSKTRCIGILTSGGDCPGLNAAIRGIAKAAIQEFGIKVIGIKDGFRGLVENRTIPLEHNDLSGVLTLGGTILGTSRDKPKKMPMGGKVMDMTRAAVVNARNNGFDCVVCLGGGGTQKNAYHLKKAGGLDVMTLPKTIDNDVAGTDVTFGFDTAMTIAAEAVDRLHTTATSHDRIIVVELMGHNSGWLALGAGIAGGADVILIPEIPYNINTVAEYLLERQRSYGKKFSIIAVAEGALTKEESELIKNGTKKKAIQKRKESDDLDYRFADEKPKPEDLLSYKLVQESIASRLARQLQGLTRTEARVTSLGHMQRGGVPTPADRLLCTRLGVKAAELLAEGVYNVMVALKNNECVPVPLEKVAGVKKTVPLNHAWIDAARQVGTCLGVPDNEIST
jgi:6-phosphofructokinase 1